MFDERTFKVKREVLEDPSRLEKSEKRDVDIIANIGIYSHLSFPSPLIHPPHPLISGFKQAALVNLLISPFLLVFLVIYFFMHNAVRAIRSEEDELDVWKGTYLHTSHFHTLHLHRSISPPRPLPGAVLLPPGITGIQALECSR